MNEKLSLEAIKEEVRKATGMVPVTMWTRLIEECKRRGISTEQGQIEAMDMWLKHNRGE